MFKPDLRTYRFAAPQVRIEGRYDVVPRKFSVEKHDWQPECFVQHAKAFQTREGWRFLAITSASMPAFPDCVIDTERVHAPPSAHAPVKQP